MCDYQSSFDASGCCPPVHDAPAVGAEKRVVGHPGMLDRPEHQLVRANHGCRMLLEVFCPVDGDRGLRALFRLSLETKPAPASLDEIILAPDGDGSDAREGIGHEGDQRAVTQADEVPMSMASSSVRVWSAEHRRPALLHRMFWASGRHGPGCAQHGRRQASRTACAALRVLP